MSRDAIFIVFLAFFTLCSHLFIVFVCVVFVVVVVVVVVVVIFAYCSEHRFLGLSLEAKRRSARKKVIYCQKYGGQDSTILIINSFKL